MMAQEWAPPPAVTPRDLVEASKAGWRSVLGTYLGPATWLAAIITWAVILAMGLVLMRARARSVGLAFIALGWPAAAFWWWQAYYMLLDGLGWVILALLAALVVSVWRFGPWASVAVGLVAVALAGWYWLQPDIWVQLAWW